MSYRLLLGVLLICIGGSILGWYGWQGNILQSIERGLDQVQNLAAHPEDILPLANQVIAPPPLRGPRSGQLTTLTADGVFTHTNEQRIANGVPALMRNPTLDLAARNKVDDLFARQYFEHVSPTGEGPGDGVDTVGYLYLKVGENLALGNFASDAALVQAWMDSPGHRANILAPGFQELGIAVGKGIFEGEETWIGVQTFATPVSACPAPTTSLKQTIEANEAKIAEIKRELAAIQQPMDEIVEEEYETKEEQEAAQEELDALRDEYNTKVTEINALITITKELIDQYNTQARAFNACMQALE